MTTAEESIASITERIVERFHPLQVILFGSLARGDAKAESDVDLLVVLPDPRDRHQAWREIREALREFTVPHDVVVTTPDEIARRGNLVGPILRPALRDGRVIYDADVGLVNWSPDMDGDSLSALVGGAVSDEERLVETERWLRQAGEDLRMAELVDDGDHAAPSAACYHAQQAAEKALKAALVFLQIEFPKTHDLDTLRNRIPRGWNVKREHPALKSLAEWVFKGRYPGDWPAPTVTDSRGASRHARAVWESVLRDLEKHGLDVAEYR